MPKNPQISPAPGGGIPKWRVLKPFWGKSRKEGKKENGYLIAQQTREGGENLALPDLGTAQVT